ncbi:MAG: 6-bladed beta-propeller [Saprospiraceae bacterium]
MKKYLSTILLLGSLLCSFCTNKLMDSDGIIVQVGQSSTRQKASDLLSIEGFTALEFNNDVELKGISKILFKDDMAIVLNYVGDKQDLWVFDQKTGKALTKIGKQNNEPDGYDGLNDIAFDGDEIRCSAAGKMSFMNYDLAGNLRSTTKSGVFGEELERTSSGEYVVYNEYNSTKISGLNHLIFYDRNGNVTKRTYPYPEAQDGNGYGFAGSLTASDGLWFNPPFCETVFEIVGHKVIPRYVFDFGQKAMPEDVRQKKMSGWDTDKYSFLSDGFAKTGRFLVLEYHDEQKAKLGVFDEVTGRFVCLRDLQQDYLYELIQLGDIFPKGQRSFALVLRPSRIRYMLKNNLLDLDGLGERHPNLVTALKNIEPKSNPLILYLAFKPNASIENVSTEK